MQNLFTRFMVQQLLNMVWLLRLSLLASSLVHRLSAEKLVRHSTRSVLVLETLLQ